MMPYEVFGQDRVGKQKTSPHRTGLWGEISRSLHKERVMGLEPTTFCLGTIDQHLL